MFSKVALFVAAAFAISAIATPVITDSCNSGPVQCCNSLNAPDSAAATQALGLLDVVLQNVVGQVGLECNPITAIGVGAGGNCASGPVCCAQNFFNQGVGINCTPIKVGA